MLAFMKERPFFIFQEKKESLAKNLAKLKCQHL